LVEQISRLLKLVLADKNVIAELEGINN